MICRRLGKGWEVIFQRNHALLAAEMLGPWREDRRPQPWSQLLNATAQHDHGWREDIDDAVIDENGHPLDFLHMPAAHAQAIVQRNLSNADSQSRWCAILAARHAECLASFKDDEQTRVFATQVQAYRRTRMAEIGVGDQQVESMYELLCWADTLSLLVLCEPSDFTRSLRLAAQGQEFLATRIDHTAWALDPWPYRTQRLDLDYEVRCLDRLAFASAEELRTLLTGTPVILKSLELRPS